MIVKNTSRIATGIRFAALALALLTIPVAQVNAQDWEAVQRRLAGAVKAGELTLEQSNVMLDALKEMQEHEEIAERKAHYEEAVEELEAAVNAGKMSEEDAERKAAGLRRELFGDHEENHADYDENDADYEAIAEQIRETVEKINSYADEIEAAVESGKVSEEAAVHELRGILAHLHGEDEEHEEHHEMEEQERAPGQITAEQIVSQMDKDNDHKISRDEASAAVQPHFEAIDTNGDGMIDVKEAQVMAQYANQAYGSTPSQSAAKAENEGALTAMDRNGDGKITKDEASEDLRLYFSKYDVNKDGVIDGKEKKELEKFFMGSKTAGKPAPAESFTAAQVVSFMDKNNDQKISPDEASADLKPYFDNFDTNGDGLIDVKEARPIDDHCRCDATSIARRCHRSPQSTSSRRLG